MLEVKQNETGIPLSYRRYDADRKATERGDEC